MRRACVIVAMAALLAPSLGRAQQAAPSPPPVSSGSGSAPARAGAHVTYVAGASFYIDAGRAEGLREGDTVEVLRDGAPIASLKVTYLSEHRASCVAIESTRPPVVGDVVRYVPRAAAAPPGAGAPATAAPAAETRSAWAGLHGRAGVRYLSVRDLDNPENGFSQPSLDLRVDGYGLGDFDVSVDVRARQTYRNWPGAQDDSSNRVYRLATTWHPAGPGQRVTVGRQFAPDLEAVNLFDGVLYEVDRGRWGAGLLAGTQPDYTDFSYDATVREYGGYYLVRGAPQTGSQWTLTFGLIDSYAEGEVNRTWLSIQGRYRGPRLSGFLSQEVDYNRGWKVSEAGESTIAPTSTFANVYYRAGEKVTLRAGYDNRRSVPLWVDRITPATVFDDSHRQGGWAGASFSLGAHLRAGADARVSTGGTAGRADGFSADIGWEGIGAAGFGLEARTTRFTNDRSDGWMHTLSAGLEIGRAAHLDFAVGRVEETDAEDSALDRTDDWIGVDLDVLLVRRWFLILSEEHYSGTFQNNDQTYAAITYRF